MQSIRASQVVGAWRLIVLGLGAYLGLMGGVGVLAGESAATGAGAEGKAGAGKPPHILCSTFPIYQITRNIVEGRKGVDVDLLVPANLGCPHDYALTPGDLRHIAKADLMVINGLGMESFLEKPLGRVGKHLIIVDSGAGQRDLLPYEAHDHAHDHDHGKRAEKHDDHEEHDHGKHAEKHDDHEEHDHGKHAEKHDDHEEHDHGNHAEKHDDDDDHHHGKHADHDEETGNPHLFASPRQAAALATRVAEGLAKQDPAGAALYKKNAAAYAERMNALADDFVALGKRLKNNRVIVSHGIFDYLARDMGLEVVAFTQPHGAAPSAAGMRELIEVIKERKPGAIFTEPQYSDRFAKTLGRETGVPLAVLDPAASGPKDAPLGYYETVMRKNMDTLKEVLGVQ